MPAGMRFDGVARLDTTAGLRHTTGNGVAFHTVSRTHEKSQRRHARGATTCDNHRMSQRGLFTIALLLSLVAHGAAAWYWSAHRKSEGAGEQGNVRLPIQVAVTTTRSTATPAAAEPEPEVVEAPEPAASEPPPVKRKPVAHAAPVTAQPKPRPDSTLVVSDTPLQPVTIARAGEGSAQAEPAIDYAGLTESYRSRVMARIESFKHYPMAARRQRVEGSLEVDLNIACDGEVASVNVEGAYGVLRSAAARSVKRAAPLPAPPPQLSCPHRLQYAMTYKLH